MKSLKILTLVLLSITVLNCRKEIVTTSTDYQIKGFAQKGPYITGSKMLISELSENLTETGRNFNSTIIDDKGSFEIKIQGLVSGFVAISSDGFYFDEVAGGLASTRLILNAVVDLSYNQKINVNVLTHLTTERIKYLVGKGTSFTQAKAQAEKEVLKIFLIDNTTKGFENLDISQGGNDNAALLAISAILQGSHSVAQLTELLTKISLDIKEDGVLDSEALKTDLINEAQILNTSKVRQNISKRYKDLNVTATIDAFEPIIENFKKKSGYTFTKKIEYPLLGSNGKPNILAMGDTVFENSTYTNFNFAANLQVGTSLVVVIKADAGSNFGFGYGLGSDKNWDISPFLSYTAPRTWKATGLSTDANIILSENTSTIFEIYENGATAPTRTIKIKVTDLPSYISLNENGKYGTNFLKLGTNLPINRGDYSIQLNINDQKTREIKIIIDYNAVAQNILTFSNLEGWTIITKALSTEKFLYRATLTLNASNFNADAKMTISGSGQINASGYVNGVYTSSFSKQYSWQ